MLHRAVVVSALLLTLALGATETARFSDRAHLLPRDTHSGIIGALPASPTASPSRSPSPKPSASPPTLAAAGVTATYQTLASLGGTLTVRIAVRNTTAAPRRWEIVLAYPPSVRSLRASWARGATITVRHSGSQYTVIAKGPLAPGATADVWLQFAIAPQQSRTVRPLRCSVDGAACVMA